MEGTHRADRILDYWFGLSRQAPKANFKLWFSGTPEVDEEIRGLFQSDVEMAVRGELNHWREGGKHPCLALILLLDQCALNIYRGRRESFDASALAIPLSTHMTLRNWAVQLPPLMRQFAYLPLEHSEKLKDQEQCVTLFEEMVEQCKREHADSGGSEELAEAVVLAQRNLEYAIDHRDVVKMYGRFPGRNHIYHRKNTAAELEYLNSGGLY